MGAVDTGSTYSFWYKWCSFKDVLEIPPTNTCSRCCVSFATVGNVGLGQLGRWRKLYAYADYQYLRANVFAASCTRSMVYGTRNILPTHKHLRPHVLPPPHRPHFFTISSAPAHSSPSPHQESPPKYDTSNPTDGVSPAPPRHPWPPPSAAIPCASSAATSRSARSWDPASHPRSP